jgi:ribonuclease HI
MNSVVGEYTGMLKLLEELNNMELKEKKISVMTDYMLVAKHINGEWKVKERTPLNFLDKIMPVLENIRKHNEVTVSWIPREDNKEADKLTIREYNIWKQVD